MFLYIYLILAVGTVLYFIAALRDAFRFLAYVKGEPSQPVGGYAPPVTLICPCKGIDPELELNLRSLLVQDYPDFEVLFVLAEQTDPAFSICSQVADDSQGRARVVIAGLSEGRGEKVHNLERGVDVARPESEVVVFADSDGRPHRDWIRRLVQPLKDAKVGAATTFRWYIPEASFLSGLQSAWNALTGAYFIWEGARRHCWGGGTALRRQTFESADVRRFWSGCVSDDLMLSRALREAGKDIVFVPSGLVATHHPTTWRKFLGFGTRQVTVMQVYERPTWFAGFLLLMLYLFAFVGGVVLSVIYAYRSNGLFLVTLGALGLIWVLMAFKGVLWLRAVQRLVPEHREELRRGWWALTVLAPLAPLVLAVNFLSSAVRKHFEWRGVTYRLHGPWKTEIVSRN